MRKILLLLFTTVLSLSAFSQDREIRLPQRPNSPGYRDYSLENKGVWCSADAEGASSIMATSKNMQFIAFTFSAGYRFNEYIKVGAGLGGKTYVNNSELRNTKNRYAIPIFFNAHGNIISAYHRGQAPYWSVNIGTAINDGCFVNPTIGYSFGGVHNNFLLGLSYTAGSFKNYQNQSTTYSYLGVKLGYEF